MNLDFLLESLQDHIDDHPRSTKTALAEKIGVGRSELVQWLDKSYGKKPTAEKAFKIYNYLQKEQSKMTTKNNDPEGLDTINAGVRARYANNGTTIKHFQDASGNAWVPGLSGEDPADTESVVDCINGVLTGQGSPDQILARLRGLLKNYKNVPSEEVQRASVNSGPTREKLVLKGSGERAQIVDGQAFQINPDGNNVLFCAKGSETLRLAKADVKKTHQNRVAKSLENANPEVSFRNEKVHGALTPKQKAFVEQQHVSVVNTPEQQEAVRRFQAFQKEREARLDAGRGNLEDLSAMRNQILYCDAKMPGVHTVDSRVLKHEDAYFNLMLETDKLNQK